MCFDFDFFTNLNHAGGKHVEYITNQITKKLVELIKKKKKDVKSSYIKDHMMVFILAVIENGSFDSQTKASSALKPCFLYVLQTAGRLLSKL